MCIRDSTSPITGNAAPMAVAPNTPIVSGCINGTGALQLEVTHALPDALVTRILEAVETAAADSSQMERRFLRFSRIYTCLLYTSISLQFCVHSYILLFILCIIDFSYLMSLSVRVARNCATSPVLFSSL